MIVTRYLGTYLLFAVLVVFVFVFAGCSTPKLIPTCLECPHHVQKWDEFAWDQLEGNWVGSIEVDIDRLTDTRKRRKWKKISFEVVTDKHFAASNCKGLPSPAKIIKHETWTQKKYRGQQVYEVLAKKGENSVSYGRLIFSGNKNNRECRYHPFGGTFVRNLIEMPAKRFTQRLTPDGRMLASGVKPELEVDFEFLRFETENAPKMSSVEFRKPASQLPNNQAPWMFRVIKTTKHLDKPFATGEWAATEEYIYRMWKRQ